MSSPVRGWDAGFTWVALGPSEQDASDWCLHGTCFASVIHNFIFKFGTWWDSFLSATFSKELWEWRETNSCPVALSHTSALKKEGRTHTEALERASRKILASLAQWLAHSCQPKTTSGKNNKEPPDLYWKFLTFRGTGGDQRATCRRLFSSFTSWFPSLVIRLAGKQWFPLIQHNGPLLT